MFRQRVWLNAFGAAPTLLSGAYLLVQAAPASGWEVSLSPAKWASTNDGPRRSIGTTVQGLRFSVRDNTPQRFSTTTWNLNADGQALDGHRYCLLTYRARGLGRSLDPNRIVKLISVVGPGQDGPETVYPVLDLSKIWLDDQEHTVLIRKPLPATANRVQVELTTDGTFADVTIKKLEFLDKIPERIGELKIQPSWDKATVSDKAFKIVSLGKQFNDSISSAFTRQMEKDGAVYGGEVRLPSGKITVDGLPFYVGSAPKNLIHAAEDLSRPVEKIKAFGIEVTRKDFLPAARNDAITIPVNAKGSELYLLLQNEAPSTHSLGVVPIPFRWPDIESFAIHLNYADGSRDLAFPWSPADGGFTIQRTLGAYAVPVDSKRLLKSVTLMNREWYKNVSVAAATLNTAGKQRFAAVWKAPAPQIPRPVTKPAPRRAFARRQGNSVVLGNRFYEVTADFSDGFVLRGLRNLSNPRAVIRLDPKSGIELDFDGRTISGKDFRTSNIVLEGASVRARLTSKDATKPISLDIRLTATDSEELQTNCTLRDEGSVRPVLKFPMLKNLSIGATKDTWIFYPQCGTSVNNQHGWYLSINTEGFAVQYMDAFNRNEGIGVGLMTRNPQSQTLEYGGIRNDSGVSQYIRYDLSRIPTDDVRGKITGILNAQSGGGTGATSATGSATLEPVKTVTTSLIFHAGDWHRANEIYTDWLRTWYKPVKAQKNQRWLDTWLIGCLWASEKISERDLHLPPIYDAKTRQYHIDEANAADLKYLGARPDGYHFYQWVHDDVNDYNLYGEKPEAMYPWVGGLEVSRKMVRDFHARGQFVSHYFIPDRYGVYTETAKELPKERIALRDAAGNYLEWDGSRSGKLETRATCTDNEEWLSHMASITNKVTRDLNSDSLYLDVFPFYRASCYAPDHGHPVPSNPNHGTMTLLKKIRDLYPAKTTVWTEYLAADVPSQYLDGCLSYSGTTTAYILNPRWDEVEDVPNLLKPEIDVTRYAFPHFKQFTLPQGYGLGWTVMKQMLFNGKGLFGGSWRQWDSDVSKLLGEQTRLLRKYTDCFNSDRPEHLVPTLRGDVYANKFPAKNRTLWTVFNASGVTIRDSVITVPHIKNARYTDAATGKALPFIVRGRTATVAMKLDPQSVSCLLQSIPNRK